MTWRLFCAIFILVILLAGCADIAEYASKTTQMGKTEQPAASDEPQIKQVAQPQQTPDEKPKASATPVPTASPSPIPETEDKYAKYADYSYVDLFACLPDSFVHLFSENTVQTVSIGQRSEVPYIRVNYTQDSMKRTDYQRFLQHVQTKEEISKESLAGNNGEVITESANYTMYPYWQGGYQLQAELSQPLKDETKQRYFNDELFDYEALTLPDAIRDLVADEEALFLYNPAVWVDEQQVPNIKTLSIWINLGEQKAKQVVDHYAALLGERELFEHITDDDGLVSIFALLDTYRMIRIYARPPHNDYTGYQLQIIIEYFFDTYTPQ